MTTISAAKMTSEILAGRMLGMHNCKTIPVHCLNASREK